MTQFRAALVGGLFLITVAVAHAADPLAPQDMKPASTFQGHAKGVFQAVYSADGTRVATSGKDAVVRVFDASTQRALLELKCGTGTVYGVAFSPDGKRVAGVGVDRFVRVWSVPEGKEELKVQLGGELYAVAFSPDGTKIAASGSKIVYLLDAAKGTALRQLAGHGDRVLGLAFSPDGGRLATACATGPSNVKIWKVDTGDELMTLPGNSRVMTVAFSADGRRLAGACGDSTVRIWEMATGRETLVFKGHTLEVYTVAFSPDGRRLASSSGQWQGDKTGEVKVWDLVEGKEVLGFGGHNRPIWTVAFRPDGKRLLTATGCWQAAEAGEAREWDVEKLLPAAKKPARAPTQDELKACWEDLASGDGGRAYRAGWALSQSPKEATAFIKDQVRPPEKVDDGAKRIAQLIADLDDRRFKVRQEAQAELARLGRAAHPALKEALKSPSAEVRKRAQEILDAGGAGPGEAPAVATEELRLIRAVEVLHRIGGADVRPTLERLAEAKGTPLAAAEAAAALAALGKEPKR